MQKGRERMEYVTGPGFGYGFTMFHILFILIFVVAFGSVLLNIIRGIGEWTKNNNSPELTVEATVVAKRTNVSRHRHGGANGHGHYRTSTTYYVTFQFESGDRMEFNMSGPEYGLLVEGDRGKLSFQGTRYLGFARV